MNNPLLPDLQLQDRMQNTKKLWTFLEYYLKVSLAILTFYKTGQTQEMVYHLKIRCTSTFFSFVNEGSGWLKRILVCKSTLWVFVYQSVYIIGQTMAALNSWDKIMWIPIYGKRGSNQKPLEHEPTKSDDMWNGSKTYKKTNINPRLLKCKTQMPKGLIYWKLLHCRPSLEDL